MDQITQQLIDHEERIKSLEKQENQNAVNQVIMKKDLSTITDTVLEIKSDVKSLSEKRLSDHYISPLENMNKLKWALITLACTSLLTMLITMFAKH